MRKGTLFVDLREEDRPRLEQRAEADHRTLREQATYLLRWALDELDRRESAKTAAA